MMNRASGSGTSRAANVARTQEYFRGLVSEIRRVTWPTRPEWIAATILTLSLVIGASIFTYLLDQAFGYIFGLVHH